jgi:hypothetical protein
MSDQGAAQGAAKANAPGSVPGLVLGIVGAALCWCYGVGLVPSIIGLVLSGKARKALATEAGKYQGQGMATAGFVLSIIGLILSIIFIVIYVIVFIVALSSNSSFRGLF